ncbi:BaiN/RdsA family NAD(P)/FAD-dependent oxidoreductase [Desulfogranum mediterraneum]|uniref:NAD(P)/FAD-dependent oxidoreductase n=1 Tax=Desulfogranum mediterraneum TaxID=160661 RepID=UPI000686373E|nr:NAD(P)/FAD-dependent oxidoreductase [Desulfogranum mediterraneum]
MQGRKVIVIGGGPAGLMAAGQAAAAGAETLVLEKMKRTGLKLRITGKGRCNLTNVAEVRDFINRFGPSGRFLRQAFARFFSEELMAFFEELGLELVTERGGRVFPASGKATEVAEQLRSWCTACGARIQTAQPVDGLVLRDGRVVGVRSQGKELECDAVVVATGGASYPRTGSSGDGYHLLEAVGHTIIAPRQALVPLETSGVDTAKLADLNLRNIGVRLLVNGKRRRQEFGEVLFTSFGLSGPVTLTLSGQVVDELRQGNGVSLSLDLKPALDEQKLEARLQRDIAGRGKEELQSLLRGLLPRELVPVCLKKTGLAADQLGFTISAKQRRRLRSWLKDFRLDVRRPRPLAEAIVTAGGVDTREIDPRTMGSKKVAGLYVVGELLDLQADTGGYNLQAAFSTGWLAGRSAAERDTPVVGTQADREAHRSC